MKRIAAFGLVSALATLLAGTPGCYAPNNGGGVFSHTGGPTTYYSSEISQKTITIVDVRTDEVVFSVDLPAGKQLTFQFDEGAGDDPVMRPDLMRYEIMDIGTTSGKLKSSQTVPNAASRKVDVDVRQRVEYAGAPPQRALRTDQVSDRPDWWTPEGGPMPEDRKTNLYDN
jgi:hypothetical protein